ncbi:hypothetical protein [Mycobacterium tuberculosis]|uniref:hypothetical protein n=1 Tax=Mycobacterium tuberculosis TaxID=1773 RepID=UPI0009111A7C|nr:hypothetical protein [Mycobacterium tuberculosis]SGI74606.1 Uncharacterised protein [Mycobacterium tuberculosis]
MIEPVNIIIFFVLFIIVGTVIWIINQRLYKGLNKIAWILTIGQFISLIVTIILVYLSINKLEHPTGLFSYYKLLLYGLTGTVGFIIPGILLYFLRSNLKIAYSEKGYLKDWYDKTRLYLIENNWTQTVIENITKSEIVNLNKKSNPDQSIIYSVGSNRGETEKEIYSLLTQNYNVKMICTDAYYEEIANKTKPIENFLYLEGNRSGEAIEDILSEISVNQVDVIIDKKSCLWYSKNLDDVFKKYYRSLSMNGVIIIDAEEISIFKSQFNNLIYQIFNRVVGSAEQSTYTKIKSALIDNSFINEHYTYHFIGEGLYRTVIFKKVK